MDGKRKAHVDGTDGSDFSHRQTIDKRYTVLASAKHFIRIGGFITLGVALATFVITLLGDNLYGIDVAGNIPVYVYSIIAAVVFLLSQRLSTQVVEEGLVHVHRSMAMVLSALSLFIAVSVLVSFPKHGVSFYSIIVIILNAFLALLSFKSHKADQDIISSLKKSA